MDTNLSDRDKRGRFIKGCVPWIKGRKSTKTSGSFKKGHISWCAGKHSEKLSLTKKRWHKERGFTQEVKKKISEKLKLYFKNHPEAIQNLREKNKGEKSTLWKGGIYSKEPEARKRYLQQRERAKKIGADGSHTQGEWELLKKQYGFVCPRCKRSEPEILLTEDHIVSTGIGGSDYIENIQPLCIECNVWKNKKIIKYEI